MTTTSPLPNLLTTSRLAAAPILAGLLLWAQQVSFTAPQTSAPILWAAFAVFALAALTDLADGWLARKLNAVSPMGAALDHAADKTLVAAGLIGYALAWAPFDLVIAGLIIVLRDLAVAGLREGLSLSGRALPVSPLGKIKTVAEMIGLGAVLLVLPLGFASTAADPASITSLALNAFAALGKVALWSAAALACITLGVYYRDANRQS